MVLIQILWSCWGFIFLWGDPYEEHEVKVPPDLHGDSLVVLAHSRQELQPRGFRLRMEQVAHKTKVALERGRR